jgi:hypothetical protein
MRRDWGPYRGVAVEEGLGLRSGETHRTAVGHRAWAGHLPEVEEDPDGWALLVSEEKEGAAVPFWVAKMLGWGSFCGWAKSDPTAFYSFSDFFLLFFFWFSGFISIFC